MKKLFIVLTLLNFTILKAQSTKKVCIAFYNQENLFDTIDSEHKIDEEFLPTAKIEWNTQKYVNKLNNMASVISALNNNNGPDILGMCEVETEIALKDLVQTLNKKNQKLYSYVFIEGPDVRGIDNAFIYKTNLVKNIQSHLFLIDSNGIGGDKTRGILLVNTIMPNNQQITFLVNHWPSRREGQKESEYKRIFVAKTLKNITDSLLKTNKNANIITLGDFNDMPTDTSISHILESTNDVKKLNTNKLYFNPFHDLYLAGKGSHYYKKEWSMLDQIMLTKNFFNPKSKVLFEPNSATIYKQDWMLETDPRFAGSPKRTFAGGKYLNGYSDHLPVYIYTELR